MRPGLSNCRKHQVLGKGMSPRSSHITVVLAFAAAGGAVALASLLDAGASEAGDRARCSASRSETVAANRSVRVFRIRSREPGVHVTRYLACYRRTGRTRALGRFDPAIGGVRQIRLAGTFVGYDVRTSSRNASDAQVRVKNTRTGRTRTARSVPNVLPASDLEVTSRGSVVWIRPVPGPGDGYEVRKLDADGEDLLDEGVDVIEPRSLAVSGSTAYWTRGGQPRSTTLRER